MATSDEKDIELVQNAVQKVAEHYRNLGFVITVEQVSLRPPRMGNHEDKVTVRKIIEY
jgi:hypothetical protein